MAGMAWARPPPVKPPQRMGDDTFSERLEEAAASGVGPNSEQHLGDDTLGKDLGEAAARARAQTACSTSARPLAAWRCPQAGARSPPA